MATVEEKEYAKEVALQAFGYYWATHLPGDVLPTDQIIAAVHAILDEHDKANQA